MTLPGFYLFLFCKRMEGVNIATIVIDGAVDALYRFGNMKGKELVEFKRTLFLSNPD